MISAARALLNIAMIKDISVISGFEVPVVVDMVSDVVLLIILLGIVLGDIPVIEAITVNGLTTVAARTSNNDMLSVV